MNILFLLGGTGKRFTTYGYTDPKPFVHIDGECIIHKVINSFNFSKKDKIDIIYNSYLDQYSFIDKINFNINFKINFEKINFNSESPIDTLNYYIQKKYDLLKKRKSRDLLILDCDTYYTCDILAEIKKTNYSTTVVFEPKEKKNIYSYCKINNKFILDIAEKKIISNYANSGAYYFKDIDYLKKTLNAITSSKIAKNQKYISLIYKHMLKKNKKISFIKISEKYIHILGTPNQLINESLKKKNNKKIFCFDLDKTLVTPPIQNDYSLCKPIKKNINYLNFLKQNGHTIIIHTARRMLTHKGNKKKVIQDIGLITKKHLKKLNINYDKIIFGKPYADFYIDDKAINAYDNLKFKLGYYPEAIKTRTFNNVEIGEKFTIKKIKNKNIFLNEKNFYQKLPNFLQFLYPKVYKIKNNELKLETIQGKNFSELLLARMINKKDIKNLFHELKFMHSFKKKKNLF